MHHSPCPFPRRAPFLNSGPFPPPELPGFPGTTSLSATPYGPACPSRASGWGLLPTDGASRVAAVSLVSACRHHYPGGTAGSDRSSEGVSAPRIFPSDGGLPRVSWRVGSHIKTFEACSVFTTRYGLPTRRTAFRYVCLEGSDGFCYLHRRSDSFRLERSNLAGWELHPLGICDLFTAHTNPICRDRPRPGYWRSMTNRPHRPARDLKIDALRHAPDGDSDHRPSVGW